MIDGQLVSLRRPTLADHEAVRGIWEDEATMRDVGGVRPLPPEKWERWHRRMFHELASANEYFLVYENSSGTCAGEVSFHDFDPSSGRAMFNVKIKRHLRGKGLGREAIDLILWHFFGAWEGTVMEDSLWEGNPGGLAVVLAYGFRETRRDADGIWVELDRAAWERKPRAQPSWRRHPVRTSAKAVIVHEGKILLVRHRQAGEDYLTLPGGGQEHNEELAATLRRECMEETGAEVEPGDIMLVRDYIADRHEFRRESPGAHQLELVFRCGLLNPDRLLAPSLQDSTQVGIAWLPVDQLADAALYPKAFREAVARCLSGKPGPVYLGAVN